MTAFLHQVTPVRKWSLTRDSEGHRTYKITWIVGTTDSKDGPGVVIRCAGLPQPGAWWVIDNEVDLWAWCRPDATVTQLTTTEPGLWWEVEQTFSTKPPDKEKQRCQDQEIKDPLLEPPKISGDFSKYQEEATKDRYGNPITNSAHEQFRGPQVEFDKNRISVKIVQNVATSLQAYIIPSQMVDTVNKYPLWGFPPRCIKLSKAPWERQFYGLCYVYFKRTLEFDINIKQDNKTDEFVSGFDRDLLDEGSSVLNGHWDPATGDWLTDPILGYTGPVNPNQNDPTHFILFKDRKGDPKRCILDGSGRPMPQKVTAQLAQCATTKALPANTYNNGTNGVGATIIFNAPPVDNTDPAYIIDGVSMALGVRILVKNEGAPANNGVYEVKVEPGLGPTGLVAGVLMRTSDFNKPAQFPGSIVHVLDGTDAPLGNKDTYWSYYQNTPPTIGTTALTYNSYVVTTPEPGSIHVERYQESDFTLLGIPLSW